jgi:phosphosulfolactate synthase
MSGSVGMRGGAFVVSLDFELHWGVRDLWSVNDYRQNLLGARAAIPALLRLFEEFEIHATWATVGLLFFESRDEMLGAFPARRPAYVAPGLSPYGALDDVGRNEREDPFHFAPSLIRRIADTPGQEIGTHTFSHYYCLEPGQSVDDFRADLECAQGVARAKIGRAAESIVFPRNQITDESLGVCRDLGLVAYRGNLDHWAYRADRRDATQSSLRRALRLADSYAPLTGTNVHAGRPAAALPVDVPASRYLRPYFPALRRFEPLRLQRIAGALERAATTGATFHLWWHPHDFGDHLDANLAFLRRVLVRFARLRDRYGMESLTMAEAARHLGAPPARASEPTSTPIREIRMPLRIQPAPITTPRVHTHDYLKRIGVPDLPPLTSPFDPGYDPTTLESHLAQSAHLISILKISMACWIVAAEEATRRKLAAARRHNVPTVTGGGPFEIAVAQGELPAYLELCADIGVTRIECGEGFTDMPLAPRTVVGMAHALGLAVQFELGKKHGGAFSERIVEQLIDQGQRWLDAGAVQLVVEARESACGVGLFDDAGRLDRGLADRFARTFGLGRLIFEAPNKPSQFALLDHFGHDVHLCNVRLEELLRVEIYRRGLHSDAFAKPGLRPPPPAQQAARGGER